MAIGFCYVCKHQTKKSQSRNNIEFCVTTAFAEWNILYLVFFSSSKCIQFVTWPGYQPTEYHVLLCLHCEFVEIKWNIKKKHAEINNIFRKKKQQTNHIVHGVHVSIEKAVKWRLFGLNRNKLRDVLFMHVLACTCLRAQIFSLSNSFDGKYLKFFFLCSVGNRY